MSKSESKSMNKSNKCQVSTKVIQFPSKENISPTTETKQYIIGTIISIATDVFRLIGRTATHTDLQKFLNGYIDSSMTGTLQLDDVKYPQNFEQYTETVEIAYIEASKQGKDVSIAYCLGFVYFAVYVHED